MKLTGEAWVYSSERRRIAERYARVMKIAARALEKSAPFLFGDEAKDQPSTHTQRRIGAAARSSTLSAFDPSQITEFDLIKLSTSVEPFGKPFNKIAAIVRKIGLDELAQCENILRGDMTLFGHRSILLATLLQEYDECNDGKLVDVHRRFVLPALTSIVSSLAGTSHIGEPGNRLELDIKDHMNASLRYDQKLMARFAYAGMAKVLHLPPPDLTV